MSNAGALISLQRMQKALVLFKKAIVDKHQVPEGWDPVEYYDDFPPYYELRMDEGIYVMAGEDYDQEFYFEDAEDFADCIRILEEKYQ